VAVAMLKGQHLMILRLDDTNKVTRVEKILQGTYGRLRTAVQGPDGVLYISTDNGTNDRIIKLIPRP
jgi:glucose/arabinose dehydrogenase